VDGLVSVAKPKSAPAVRPEHTGSTDSDSGCIASSTYGGSVRSPVDSDPFDLVDVPVSLSVVESTLPGTVPRTRQLPSHERSTGTTVDVRGSSWKT
jgi:hypothetical protein